jgi:hypothetical protein
MTFCLVWCCGIAFAFTVANIVACDVFINDIDIERRYKDEFQQFYHQVAGSYTEGCRLHNSQRMPISRAGSPIACHY